MDETATPCSGSGETREPYGCPICSRVHRGVPPATAGGRPSVLVVEDEPEIADLLAWHFAADGWSVAVAGDGAAAIAAVEVGQPDLLVLDLLLPIRSGWHVLRHLRSHPRARLRTLPIVVVSALACDRLSREIAQEGAQHLLGKPFSLAELRAVSRRLLDSRSLHAPLTGPTPTRV